MKRSTRRDHQQGAAAVEFALVLPVLLLIVFGIIDFGRMLNAKLILTEATSEAARASALSAPGAASGAATNRFNQVAAATLGSVAPEVDACPLTPSANSTTTVTARYTFEFITPIGFLLGGDGDTTLTSTGVMPCIN